MSEELFYERQRRIEAELRAAILKAGEQDVVISRLREELTAEREKFTHENRLAGHLAREVGRRDCEIAGMRAVLGEIVIACDEGGSVGRIRELAQDGLEVER
jgi:hypothetical protein